MSLKNLTPEHLRCAVGASCPSVHELDDGRWLIVGEAAETVQLAPGYFTVNAGIEVPVVEGEHAIIISPELLSGVFLNVRQTAEQAEETVSPLALHSGDSAEASWTSGTTWRHKKTGGIYTTVGRCRLEANGEPAVLYRGTCGTVWARDMDEFLDGRFERIEASTSPGVKSAEGAIPSKPPRESQPDTKNVLEGEKT